MSVARLTKIQVAAEFVLEDGEDLVPATFGPIQLTPREWREFDLQQAIEAGLAEAEVPSANRATRRARKTPEANR